MAAISNTFPLVLARFMLACPFLIASVTTFALLRDKATTGYVIEENKALIRALGDFGKQVPQDKLAIFLAVLQGMGGFLMVFNHKFGGLLLTLYLLPMTLLTQQFWKEEHISLGLQQEALVSFLKNFGLLGGILMFMATTDGVPLKVKRKAHLD
ncbi:hypothetical protein VaNZ11_013826 [Volvox africanus]|uniref:Uncharacterized protein n=1 Tax=Volvox africanus TaxID=51714 RepID=A0ABQ5SHV9_9CHLO|nr:hypothetical protein VaNZ11_013826 [Volvox africanus]